MDCHKIEFSVKNSKNRISNAIGIFEPAVLFKILAFAFHMMGNLLHQEVMMKLYGSGMQKQEKN